MKLSIQLVFITILALFEASTVSGQTDTRFWFSVPEINRYHTGGTDANHATKGGPTYLRLTSGPLPSTVTISMPANSNNFNGGIPYIVMVPPNTTKTLDLQALGFVGDDNLTAPFGEHPLTSMENRLLWTQSSLTASKKYVNRNNKGVFIEATTPITAYYEIGSKANMELIALKGENALGNEFFVPFQTNYPTTTTQYSTTNHQYRPYSSIDIVATEDNTEIEITPTQEVFAFPNQSLPAEPFRIWLNKGETAIIPPFANNSRIYNTSYTKRLSGTKVKVLSGGRIAIITRDDMVMAPTGNVDFVGDQIVPTSLIGLDYAVVRGQLASTLEYAYVVATQDGTTITTNGIVVGTINASATLPIQIPSASLITTIHADKPVYVFHLTGFTSGGTQSQFAGAIIPTISVCTGSSQVAFNRTKANVSGVGYYDYFINLLVRDGAETNFTIVDKYGNDATALIPALNNPASYTQVGTTAPFNQWRYARFQANNLLSGPDEAYQIKNSKDVFHLGVLNGYGNYDAFYGYFSDFNAFDPSTFVVETGGPGAKQCAGATLQLYASGGTKYEWTPTTYLDDPTKATPIASNITSTILYNVKVSGSCGLSKDIHVPVIIGSVTPMFDVDAVAGCSPFTVKITNKSIGSGENQWDLNSDGDFNDPGEGENNSGEFFVPLERNLTNEVKYQSITLYATSTNNSCNKSYTKQITIYPEIQAAFTASVTTGCTPLAVSFTNTSSTNTADSYRWVFGDGQTESLTTQAPVNHTYLNTTNATKMYNMQLVAESPFGCRDSIKQTFNVAPKLNAQFVVSATQGCSPLMVNFTDQSQGDVATWELDYNNDGVYEQTTKGNYAIVYTNTTSAEKVETLTLRITSAGGCVETKQQTITVYPEVHAAFTPSVTAGCTPLAVNFTNESNPANATFNWQFGDNSGTFDHNPQHIYTNSSSVEIKRSATLIAESTYGCKDIVHKDITIYGKIAANLNIENAEGCSPLTVNINSNLEEGISAVDWDWNGDGVIDSTSTKIDKTVNHVYRNLTSNTQILNLTIKASNQGNCSDTKVFQVTVYPEFSVNIGSDQTICQDETVMLDAGIDNAQYKWNTGASSKTISVKTTGNYQVTVTDINGCKASDNATVTVNPTPIVNLGGAQSICQNETLLLDAENAGATYLWNTGAISQTISVNQTGRFTVKVTNDYQCSNSGEANVTVRPIPTVNIGVDTIDVATFPFLIKPMQVDPGLYLWSNGSTNLNTTIYTSGTYTLQTTNTYGCSNADSITIRNTTGIVDLSKTAQISIFPNPAQNELNVSISSPKQQVYTIELHSFQGQILKRIFTEPTFNYFEKIDVGDLAPGVYAIRIATKEAHKIIKVVINL
jgi:PKD repeat protein